MRLVINSKRELELLNRKTLNYPLAIAEKDYFLALVSKLIYESPLKEKIVFKGGTALHHCYLGQYRFSEDLDFGSLNKSIRVEEVKAVLELPDFLFVKKEFTSTATIKIEKLQYIGPLGQPNSLKLEIDYLQDVVLPPKELEYHNVWGVKTKVRIMDIKEICAEKIRTISDRARYRDFYDLFLILEKFDFDMDEILNLIKQKEIRNPISKERIQANWRVVSENKEQEISTIYYSREIADKKIKAMFEQLPFEIIDKEED